MIRVVLPALLILGPGLLTACAGGDDTSKVLGSVRIAEGERTGDASTVNGSIDLGANCVVKDAETVNGSVKMHEHAFAESVTTVNGSVHLDQGARVSGGVVVVNGSISLDSGADVGGAATNVNGLIHLNGAHVGKGIKTSSGDIELDGGSRVEGGILVANDNGGWFHFGTWRRPRIVIGPGAVVQGTLVFKREVQLYVSDRASTGPVDGATAMRFSGAEP